MKHGKESFGTNGTHAPMNGVAHSIRKVRNADRSSSSKKSGQASPASAQPQRRETVKDKVTTTRLVADPASQRKLIVDAEIPLLEATEDVTAPNASLSTIHASKIDQMPDDDPDFVEALYLAVNPDVLDSLESGEFESGFAHWTSYGKEEHARGRRPTILNASHYIAGPGQEVDTGDTVETIGKFDAEGYLFLNADVRQALGSDPKAAEEHWYRHGKTERRARPGFTPFRTRTASPADVLARPFGINVHGPFAAVSGLGTAARGMVRALQAAGIPVELWNFDTSKGYLRVTDRDRSRPPAYRINLLLANADTVEKLFLAYPPGQFDSAYNIAIWQWELASFRPDWFTSFGGVDEVWTNSDFQVMAIGASSPVPVVKIHLPVQPGRHHRKASRAEFGLPNDSYIFLCAFDIGSTSDRKNPFAVIDAFCQVFGKDRRAFLVLKFHSIRHEPAFIARLNRTIRGMHNVLVIADQLGEVEMSNLRELCDCLVSAHRSEGFGLNIAEFMALGKPVIATNYSGSVDFLDDEVGFTVDYKLVELDRWVGPYGRGYVWAEPEKASLTAQMHFVFDNPAEAARRGKLAGERMAARFSYAAVGQTIRERFNALDLDAKPVRFLEWLGRSPSKAVFSSRIGGHSLAERSAPLPDSAPLLSVVMPVYNVPGDLLEQCFNSVINQTYTNWELCVCNDGSKRADTIAVLNKYRGVSPKIKIRDLPGNSGISVASNAAAEMAVGDYIVLLDNDDELDWEALWEVALAIGANGKLDCIYSDEDKIDMHGRQIDHFFKPDWSPEHLESVMYVLHMFVIRKALFHRLRGFRPEYDGAQDYDLMLRCSRATEHIHHIPKALYHWRAIPGSSAEQVDAKPSALMAGIRALQEHSTLKYGEDARVTPGLTQGTFRVQRPIPGNLRVSLLILTNNGHAELPERGDVCLVDNFVDSIIARTDYPDYEIIVVDNSTLTAKQIKRFEKLGVKVENFENGGKPFNYAAKANYAVSRVRTEHLVLLNDDMEIIDSGWLTALLQFSCDPEIGAVGARLLHFDGTIQHVGIVLGINGGVAHMYHRFPEEMIGYNAFTHIVRNYSAVTAACFATRRSVLAQVGGFDEEFAVDFNDIDLCLRMRQAGYRIVYTPFAEMYHFEGASAKRTTQNPAEVDLFYRRWAECIDADPYYNPNLARDRLDYANRDWSPRLSSAAE